MLNGFCAVHYAVHVTVALVSVATLNLALPAPPDNFETFESTLYMKSESMPLTYLFKSIILLYHNHCKALALGPPQQGKYPGKTQKANHSADVQSIKF